MNNTRSERINAFLEKLWGMMEDMYEPDTMDVFNIMVDASNKITEVQEEDEKMPKA